MGVDFARIGYLSYCAKERGSRASGSDEDPDCRRLAIQDYAKTYQLLAAASGSRLQAGRTGGNRVRARQAPCAGCSHFVTCRWRVTVTAATQGAPSSRTTNSASATGHFDAEVLVQGRWPPPGVHVEADLDEERLVDFFQRVCSSAGAAAGCPAAAVAVLDDGAPLAVSS